MAKLIALMKPLLRRTLVL